MRKLGSPDPTLIRVSSLQAMRAFREYLKTPPSLSKPKTGLFGIKGLNSSRDLTRFAKTSLQKAYTLSEELKQPRTSAGNKEIRKLDELSDTLCRAVDMAAFLRIAHPNSSMAESAQQVHELLFGFMSELNTSRELFNVVKLALENPEVTNEERKVGEILKHDFLKSGLQFDANPQQQQRFVELSNSISIRGQQFLYGCGQSEFPDPELSSSGDASDTPSLDLTFGVSELGGVSPALLARLAQLSGPKALMANKIILPRDQPGIAEHIMATASSSETRKKIWQATRTAPHHQIALLDSVLAERKELAMLTGYENFAEYELGDKLMQKPENVKRFLTSLASTMYPLSQSELGKIGSPQNPWDYSYSLNKYRSQLRRMASPPQFELASVFETIGDLTEKLYGLKLAPGDVAPGEVWDPEVKRIDVYDEHSGNNRVGVIYCDLMSRPGKQPNPAHFTVQCARKVFGDNGEPDKLQLPIIALVCDFEANSLSGNVMLQFHEVQTLFHEMGHAIHSMIGTTDLHNVAGTRCATDFVELPSILFEKFASRPEVLSMMKPELDSQSFLQKQSKIDAASQNCEVWYQLTLSFLDQALHSNPFDRLQSSQLVANEVAKDCTLYPNTPITDQFSQQYAHFGHLISYGATYYSYLFDRCLAAMVWETCFEQFNQWDKGGRQFKEHVLQWGGSRDCNDCMEDLLGRSFDHGEVASYLVHERQR